ncbi:MAG: hypothetical protein CVT77_04510 [Alphaproteobacteria bacterium HGW-Alphaproteobacteria-16]|nr:MAG: hypothetical protein CVT77_04510 [Alphaproteobacteria bacterium HGW-Alphaproteobacteria-16]
MNQTAELPPDPAIETDRRAGERFTTLFQVARVLTEDGTQRLCLIRNIGPGGLMLETYTPFEPGTRVRVEPKMCGSLTGTICWAREKHAGIAFDQPIEVQEYLKSCTLPEGQVPRGPRVITGRRGRLRVGPIWHLVNVIDLSQGGAKVETDLPVEMNAQVELSIDRFTSLPGRVRWIRDERVGITFTSALPLADLAHWTAMLPPATSGAMPHAS